MPINYRSELWDTVNRASELWYRDSSGKLVEFGGLIIASTASINTAQIGTEDATITTTTFNASVLGASSIASIARMESPFLRAPSALVSTATILGNLNASGASINGIIGANLYPTISMSGFASGATTDVQRFVVPQSGNWLSFTMFTRTPVSAASLTIDINKNATSIFDTVGRLNILGGGTFASTASIATKAFNRGDFFTVDIDTGGNVADVTVMGEGIG